MEAQDEIPDDFWEIAEQRLLSMPSGMKISVGGSPEPLSKDEILKHLADKDSIGRTFAKRELIFVRSLAKLTARSAV